MNVGVEHTLFGAQTIAAQSGSCIVVHLISVVELTIVEHLLARNGIAGVDTLNGAQLVLVGFAWQRFLPVDMRSDGFTVAVFGYHVRLVTSILRIGKTCAYNAVAHPRDKLLVL